MSELNQLQKMLRTQKLSITKPRQLVFERLLGEEPLSMHELYKLCQGSIDRASLYRTIALFERLGIVQRLQIGWKYKIELSNAFQHHHHHLTCLGCGQIIPLGEDEDLERRLHELANHAHFLPEDHQVEIRGLCATCQQNA